MMIFEKWRVLTAVFILLGVISSSCKTKLHSKSKPKAEKEAQSSTDDEQILVVMQTGLDTPIIGKKTRQVWIKKRRTSRDSLSKLYATLGTGDYRVGIREIRLFLKENPKDLGGILALTLALALDQQYGLAFYYAEIAEKLGGKSAFIENIRGLVSMHRPKRSLSDYKEAITHFQAAFSLDKKEIASGLNLGNLFLDMGDARSARQVFKKVVERCRRCEHGLKGLALSQYQLGNFNPATRLFTEIIKKNPDSGSALFHLRQLKKSPKTHANDSSSSDVMVWPASVQGDTD